MKKILIYLWSMWMIQTVSAQKLKLPQAQLAGSGVITKQEQLVGYYAMYFLGNKDKSSQNYEWAVYDPNMVLIYKTRFDFPSDSRLSLIVQSAVFNGQLLTVRCLTEGVTALLNFDEQGHFYDNKIVWSAASYVDLNFKTYYLMQQLIGMEGVGNLCVRDGKFMGFAPNDTAQASWKPKEQYYLFYIGNTEKTLLFFAKPSRWKERYIIQGLDIKTGKPLWEKRLEDAQYFCKYERTLQISPKTWRIIGHYYAHLDLNTSLGLVSCVLDEQGNILKKEYMKWADVYPFVSVAGEPAPPVDKPESLDSLKRIRARWKGEHYLYAHKFIKGADKIFVIAEHCYSKWNFLDRNLMIGNLYVLELDLDFKFQRAIAIEKPVVTGRGTWYEVESGLVSYDRSSYSDGMQYDFTQVDKSQNTFTIAYKGIFKYKELNEHDVLVKREQAIFHFVRYEDGKCSRDKVEISKRAKNAGVFPSKTGYVTVWEDLGDNETSFRTEKLNFD